MSIDNIKQREGDICVFGQIRGTKYIASFRPRTAFTFPKGADFAVIRMNQRPSFM